MTSRRQRILVITRNFPPLTGGMERLNYEAFMSLQKEFDVALCGPRGCADYTNGSPCDEFPASPAWDYLFGSLFSALRMAIKFKPDMIYAGSGLAAHAAMFAGFIARAPVLTYLHGLDIIAPNRIYQTCFLPIIRRSDALIANSKNTARLAIQAGILANRISIIHPGVTLPEHIDRNIQSDAFREKHCLQNRPLLLSVGRLTARKGLVEFIEQCMPSIVKTFPSTCLVVIGEVPVEALGGTDRDIAMKIRMAIAKHELDHHVIQLGKVTDEELSSAYCAANLFVFPVLEIPGDVEGFGMVAIEAAAHGLPTAGFAVGGIPDAVTEGISGNLAAPGNYDQLTKIILHHLGTPKTDRSIDCLQHAKSFSWAHFGQNLSKLCASVLNHSSAQ